MHKVLGTLKMFISLPLPLKLFIQSLNYVNITSKQTCLHYIDIVKFQTFFSEHHCGLLDVSTVSSLLFLPIFLLRIFSSGAFLNSHPPTHASNLYHNNGNLIVSLEHETYMHVCFLQAPYSCTEFPASLTLVQKQILKLSHLGIY